MIVLIGATGTVGRHVAHELTARGMPFCALVRDGFIPTRVSSPTLRTSLRARLNRAITGSLNKMSQYRWKKGLRSLKYAASD